VIVTCERCSTQFRLDSKRVPTEGVRVRCSRCKHAFRVDPPAATEEERVDQAAARALEPDTPDITQDMPDEEEDWEFNDERTEPEAGPETEPEEAAASGAIDSAQDDLSHDATETVMGDADAYGFGLDGPSLTDSDTTGGDAPLPTSGLEIDGPTGHSPSPLSEAEGPPELLAEGASAEGAGLDLGEDGAASSGLDLGGSEATDGGLDLGEEPEGASGLDLAGAEAPQLEAPEPLAEAEQGGPSREMGSPDEWDFFAETSSKPAKSRISSVPVARRPPASASLPASHDLIDADDALQNAWLGRVGAAIGWLGVAVLFAGALYAGFGAQTQRVLPVPAAQQVGGVQVDQVSGRWVDNLVVGDLYVVSAQMQRDAAAASGPEDGLFLILLDVRGERIKRAPVPFGPPLPDALLRQVDPSDLQRVATQQRFFGPGVSRRIEAVIPSVPASASAFRFATSAQVAEWRARASAGSL
jgi:predicted Zn finger-like uncharacterized protein